MSQSDQKAAVFNAEQQTISEGEQFQQAPIPKTANLDQKLRESYPQSFFDKSKRKSSARKSLVPQDQAEKLSVSNASQKKSARSPSKNKKASEKKSNKRQLLEKKSDKKQAAAQVEASKQKIMGTKTMRSTIKEGKNFAIMDNQKNGGPQPHIPKLQKTSTINQTINEAELFLGKSKQKKVTISKEGRSKTPKKSQGQGLNTRSKSQNKKRGRPSLSKDSKKVEDQRKSKSNKKLPNLKSSSKIANKSAIIHNTKERSKSAKKENDKTHNSRSLSKDMKPKGAKETKDSKGKSNSKRVTISKDRASWNNSSKIGRPSKNNRQVSGEKAEKKRKTS